MLHCGYGSYADLEMPLQLFFRIWVPGVDWIWLFRFGGLAFVLVFTASGLFSVLIFYWIYFCLVVLSGLCSLVLCSVFNSHPGLLRVVSLPIFLVFRAVG